MAPTFLVKALKRISTLAFPDAKSRPSQDTIQLIAHTANGDLRSAINSLQFLSRSGASGNGLNAKAAVPRVKASGKGSRGGKGAKLNSSEEVKKLYVSALLRCCRCFWARDPHADAMNSQIECRRKTRAKSGFVSRLRQSLIQ